MEDQLWKVSRSPHPQNGISVSTPLHLACVGIEKWALSLHLSLSTSLSTVFPCSIHALSLLASLSLETFGGPWNQHMSPLLEVPSELSYESPSHICSAAISAAQTRIQCSFNNYFYLTPGQRTSIPMIPSKCWTLPRRQTENMTNNPRSGWRPFGCLLRDSMRDIMNIFIWSHSWQEKLSVLSAACCCFLWRMTVCFEAHTQRTKAHDVC